mmetsp:Transcript_30017/g.34738  ORF Transcript_30017/g.34738 Transcript_30017/m.34738 type:complete len:108 (-) Transcript_30017:2-325(-)
MRRTCLLYSISTVVRATKLRFKCNNIPLHQEIYSKLENKFGQNGNANTEEVLNFICQEEGLQSRRFTDIQSAERLLRKKQALVAVFDLCDCGWKYMYIDNPSETSEK